MTKEQLSELFNKYLLRDFNHVEWDVHGRKNYKAFEEELLNCNEYKSINWFKEKAQDVKVKIAVASNKNFKDKSLPVLMPTLLQAGIEKESIHVFVGGYDEYKHEVHMDVQFYFLDHNSYEYSPLIEIVEKQMESDYWFLIHDTCKVGPAFKEKLFNIPKSLPEKIAMKHHPCMSIGLYKYSYLLSVKDKLMKIKNKDYSEASMNKWKDWGVWNEDYILFKTEPPPLVYPSKVSIEKKGINNWYGSNTVRVVEYYPGLDVYKNKANWGQTNGRGGKNMVKTL
jgi:hypothetical protein